MEHVFVTDGTRAYFLDLLSVRVSGLFFESLTVLLTVCLTVLLTRARDVDEFSGKINFRKNQKNKIRRKKYDRRNNKNSW